MKQKMIPLMMPLLLLWVVVSVQGQQGRTTALLLAQYPKSPAFNAIIKSHLGGGSAPALVPAGTFKTVFHSTWFYSGEPNVAEQCFVDENGRYLSYRDCYNWAIQAAVPARLKAGDLNTLKATVSQPPSFSAKPSLNHLLIVSFRSGNKWTTRIYDRANLPAPMSQIYKMLRTYDQYGPRVEAVK